VLDVGAGREPGNWTTITGGAADGYGMLGVWITTDQPPGEYTLRLRVTTSDGVPVEDRRVVQLRP
jgi:hypothetical protein